VEGEIVPVEIVMPRLSDSMEEGRILQWFVAAGDSVKRGEPLVEVETDKASVTYESEQDGTVLAISAQVGESVPVGTVIASVAEAGEGVTVSPGAGGRVKASPVARRIAARLGVDLATLAGSGPQGRVIRADVERSAAVTGGVAAGVTGAEARVTGAEAGVTGAEADNGSEGAGPDTAAPGSAKGDTTREQLTRRQQTIARRMAQSRATVPDFELRCEIDMTGVVALREQMRQVADPAPSYNDFLVKAAALALREFPRVNGAYRDGDFEHYARVNVGIAVAAPDALVVPTIFDADIKPLGEIAAVARELAAKVRDGSITPAELSAGTFSVSNLGMYGLDSFSAVVNPPQAAILAVGSLKLRPVVDESDPAHPAIVARHTIHVSLACDHRILYGADGARFLARLRSLLEKPVALVL
jgi:pyruvate dehydrogenase E2 component (dihydrolipoamide acetyltransferase)